MKARHEFSTTEDYNKYLKAYFVAMAMQGLCANQPFLNNLNGVPEDVEIACTEMADALITELNKQP